MMMMTVMMVMMVMMMMMMMMMMAMIHGDLDEGLHFETCIFSTTFNFNRWSVGCEVDLVRLNRISEAINQ